MQKIETGQRAAGVEAPPRYELASKLTVIDPERLTPNGLLPIHNDWLRNHEILLAAVLSEKIPFFGVHGTSHNHLQSIVATKTALVQMATFYEKERSETQLFRLYHMCAYASRYAFRDTRAGEDQGGPGGILVFNLEEKGRNITVPWERLKPGSLGSGLSFDSTTHSAEWDKMDDAENLLWRTTRNFRGERYDERMSGIVGPEIPNRYAGSKHLGPSIMRDRIVSQQILALAIEMVMNNELQRNP